MPGRYCGIDPGIFGGAALIDVLQNGKIKVLELIDLPIVGDGASRRINAVALRNWIEGSYLPPDHTFIEAASAMPRQGTVSIFRYGRAVGALEAVIACCEIPITMVAPASWKRHFNLHGPDKEQSRQRAIQQFPDAVPFLTLRKHHGRSEALLLAAYGAHLLAKNNNATSSSEFNKPTKV
jgi:hypothetical protein